MDRIICVLIILVSVLCHTRALSEEERAAALDLAIGASSSTLLRFERVCAKVASRQERVAELEILKRDLLKSFAEIVDSKLSPEEKKQHESVRDTIFMTIMDDYVQVCSSEEDPQTRLKNLKMHAEMFSNARPKSTFFRTTKFENCRWAGTAPFCNGRCPDGWWLKSSDVYGDGHRCLTGRKALCCQ